jgi:hypothetical protein
MIIKNEDFPLDTSLLLYITVQIYKDSMFSRENKLHQNIKS